MRILSVIASQVVANKAITADMPGESVSGYINVKTFAPGDIDGWAFSMELGTGEQDLGDGDMSKANARLSYSNDKFGFLIYGSENSRDQTQIIERWTHAPLVSAGSLIPKQIEYRNYLLERTDEAYGGTYRVLFGQWREGLCFNHQHTVHGRRAKKSLVFLLPLRASCKFWRLAHR